MFAHFFTDAAANVTYILRSDVQSIRQIITLFNIGEFDL